MKIISRTDAKANGLTRYFTGEPCSHGHVAERGVTDYRCLECHRLKCASPKERERRREYFSDWQRQYRRKHPDRIATSEQKRDKPKRASDKRELRAKDPELHKAALRKSYKKHKVKRMAEAKAWKDANPEQWSALQRAAKSRRRALELAAEGTFTRHDIERLLVNQQSICVTCPTDISTNYHVDHIQPLARGGSNWPENLQLLCPACNRSKGAKSMDDFISL